MGKKLLLWIIGMLIGISIVILIVFYLTKNNTKEELAIDNNNLLVEIRGIKQGDVFENEIIISNETNKDITYNINWENVENAYINQSDLLYTITGEGEGTRSIGNSQIPVANFSVLENVTIKAGSEHKYTVKVTYEKSTDSLDTSTSSFKGNLIVEEIAPEK